MQDTTLSHKQFQQKHLQLSKITQKMDTFIQHLKTKNMDMTQTTSTQTVHKNYICNDVRQKMHKLNHGIIGMKEQFSTIKNDFILCQEFSKEFGRMMLQIVGVCAKNWEVKEQQYRKQVSSLTQLNQQLRLKLEQKQKQLETYKQKNSPKKLVQLQTPIHSNPPPKPNLRLQQHLHPTLAPSIACFQSSASVPHLCPNPHPEPEPEGEEDLDSYINNMEITIRENGENDDPLFKKITEHCSQEEEEESSCQYDRHVVRKNVTARSDLILEDFGDVKGRKISQTNAGQAKPQKYQKNQQYQDQNLSRNTFWNKLSKTLNPKSKTRKSSISSQSKQNILTKMMPNNEKQLPHLKNGNLTTKMESTDKKIHTSKITDFRRLLFVEKGMQRLGFRVQNIM